jgi:hypothetical protein
MTSDGELYALIIHDGKLFQEMIDRMQTTVRQFREAALCGNGLASSMLSRPK